MTRVDKLVILLTLFYLLVNLLVLSDYGLTWDFHHHFFAGAKFLGYEWYDIEPRNLPYIYPDPRFTTDLPYGPLISIIPVGSFLIFYRWLHLLPFDVAYNTVSTIVGSLGPIILYFFLRESLKDRRIAAVAAIFLALTPRYFGDLHNNMKDIPMAVVFAANVWLLWRLGSYRRPKDLVVASAGLALAFLTKVNAVILLPLFAVWLATVYLTSKIRSVNLKKFRLPLAYFLVGPLSAFLFWSLFWPDPIGRIERMISLIGTGTTGIQVMFNGKWYSSGIDVPWYYPYGYLAVTTPLPILIFFIIGTIICLIHYVRKHNLTGSLLLLWFFIPLTRYLTPKTGVIDGIRHFEEVVFPLAAIAAIGFTSCLHFFGFFIRPPLGVLQGVALRKLLTVGLSVGIIGYLAIQIILYHPYQITYFNELVGGVRCAFGKWDLDYWGTSQKAAVEWLNENAPLGSSVTIAMAPNVAALYLRPDLLDRVIIDGYNQADYVVVLNRQAFFYRYAGLFPYLLTHRPVYTVSIRGVPLTWVFDNRLGVFPPIDPWWETSARCIPPPFEG